MPDLKNLLWKMCWNILPTCFVLNNRFPLPSLECYLCSNATESLEHLMLLCDWVVQVWLLAPRPLILNKLSSLSMVDWIKVILNQKTKLGLDEEAARDFQLYVARDFQLYAAILCDQIWMSKNIAKVEGTKSNLVELARQIHKIFQEHKQAWRLQLLKPSRKIQWSPPLAN